MPKTTPVTPAETDPKRRYLCRHVFTEGHRCGSPALRGESLCYYHNRSRREAGISGRSGTFPMPRVDDRASIQLALYEVLSRLAGGDIEYKRGSILLYGLQIASANLPRRARIDAQQQPQVEEVTSDYNLGDLAPITEIPDPAPPVQAQEYVERIAPMNAAKDLDARVDDGANARIDRIVILSEAKSPRIPPEAPQNSQHTQPLPAAMRTRTSQQLATCSPLHTASSPQPITLAAVQAVADRTDRICRILEPSTIPSSVSQSPTPYNGINDFVQSALSACPCRVSISG